MVLFVLAQVSVSQSVNSLSPLLSSPLPHPRGSDRDTTLPKPERPLSKGQTVGVGEGKEQHTLTHLGLQKNRVVEFYRLRENLSNFSLSHPALLLCWPLAGGVFIYLFYLGLYNSSYPSNANAMLLPVAPQSGTSLYAASPTFSNPAGQRCTVGHAVKTKGGNREGDGT